MIFSTIINKNKGEYYEMISQEKQQTKCSQYNGVVHRLPAKNDDAHTISKTQIRSSLPMIFN